MDKKKTYNWLIGITIVLVMMPAFQLFTGLFKEKPLKGVYIRQELPEFTIKKWYDFDFQPRLHDYLIQNYGFRPSFIRIFNQIDYSLFGISHGSGVVIGKDNYLYEKWYIDSYYGEDFIGKDEIHDKLSSLSDLCSVFNSAGKELLVVLAPGKATYYPEYIPDNLTGRKGSNNYEIYRELLSEMDIPFLDFNDWFKSIKDTVPSPLFPKTGTHWSQYGARLSLDTLSGYISKHLEFGLPDVVLKEKPLTIKLINPDTDLEDLSNLIFKMDRDPLMYPDIYIEEKASDDLIDCVAISDSYFWQIFNLGLDNRLFKTLKYWYYNSSIYPDSYREPMKTEDLDIRQALAHVELVIIMASPALLNDFGWGFVERAHQEIHTKYDFKPQEELITPHISRYESFIRESEEWMDYIRRKAKERNITVDSMIYLDARWSVEQDIIHGKL